MLPVGERRGGGDLARSDSGGEDWSAWSRVSWGGGFRWEGRVTGREVHCHC